MKSLLLRKTIDVLTGAIFIALVLVFLMPVIITFTNSFMTENELSGRYFSNTVNSLFSYKKGIGIIPMPFSLEHYANIICRNYEYLFMFWQSLKIAFLSTLGTVFVSAIVGFLFGRFDFPLKKVFFAVYLLVLFLPFSVTLLPNYLLIRNIGLYNTDFALILPAVFAPIGVILMTAFISELPDEFFEASILETNSLFVVFKHILLPSIYPAIASLTILAFSENCNMVEQPQVLIENQLLMPLSISLNSIYGNNNSIKFAGSVLYIVPIIILFLYCEDSIMAELKVIGGAPLVK